MLAEAAEALLVTRQTAPLRSKRTGTRSHAPARLAKLIETTRAELRDAFDRWESEVARPFFKCADPKAIDEHWSEWIAWSRPVLEGLFTKIFEVLQREPDLLAEMDAQPLNTVQGHIQESLGNDLAETYDFARRAINSGDLLVLRNLDRLESTDDDTKRQFERMSNARVGVLLAFLLLALAFEVPENKATVAEHGRFLVLTLRRQATVYLSSVQKILDRK